MIDTKLKTVNNPLKANILRAVNQLRLGNFLTGVDPQKTEQEVKALYIKMDPSDSTHWRRTMVAEPATTASKKQQLKEISAFKNMIETELTTTPAADSASAKNLRQSLRALLLRKKQLQAAISAGEDRVLRRHGAASVWMAAVRPDPSQAEDIIRRLARTSDRRASYAAWLRSAARAAARAPEPSDRPARAIRPHISAGGALVWKGPVGAGAGAGAAKAARTQSLAGRDPTLQPGGSGSESWSQLKRRADYKVARCAPAPAPGGSPDNIPRPAPDIPRPAAWSHGIGDGRGQGASKGGCHGAPARGRSSGGAARCARCATDSRDGEALGAALGPGESARQPSR